MMLVQTSSSAIRKMNLLGLVATAVWLAMLPSPAFAYTTKSAKDGAACQKDGSTCNVYCNNGQLAGSMNWNRSVWTDGVKWDADFNAEARKICAANGTDCQ